MFNGIIRYLGRIISIYGLSKLTISSEFSGLIEGSSIACNGVCLTIESYQLNSFDVYISNETMACTNLSLLKVNDLVNLETAMRFGENIDGHLISGHVDCTIAVTSIIQSGESYIFKFFLPQKYHKFITRKASVAINGVSVTVNAVGIDYFEVNIIPYTFYHTNFQYLSAGSMVNLEIDLFARYINSIIDAKSS